MNWYDLPLEIFSYLNISLSVFCPKNGPTMDHFQASNVEKCFLVSCRDEFNIQVLHAFVELHEFTDLNLVQALR